jgi:hypothetical protein
VHAFGTPLTTQEKALSNRFDRLFNGRSPLRRPAFVSGAQKAHAAVLDNYLSNTGPTNWITFTNIGYWGTDYLDRASITEFIQFGNGLDTAAYYHTFKDAAGAPLDGSSSDYVLTFPANNLPETRRFWSLTAYLPESIELVPNTTRTYVVGSYTPGLAKAADGSVSIYMAQIKPDGVPAANWLPIPDGPFNIMLRNYGPTGSAANGSYLPPAVQHAP